MDINLTSQVLTYANLAAFPATGVVKTIYIAIDTDIPYYWDGAAYVSIGGSSNAPIVVSTNQTAANDSIYTVVATATFTDPTPAEGKGYRVFVRNGTATIGGTTYSVAGSSIFRVYHSGSWSNYYDSPYNDATSSIQTALNNKEPLKGNDDNYVTDAQLTVIQNTSGTNTGDNATNSTSNSYADGKVTQVITNGVTDKAPSEDAVFDALALKANTSALPYDISGYRKIGDNTFKFYYTQGLMCSPTTTSAFVRNQAWYCPLIISKTTTLSELLMNISAGGTAGSVVRMAIYDSSDFLPNNLILNAGTILGDSATAQSITGLNTVLTPRLYFLYMNHNSVANITFRCVALTSCFNLGFTNALGGITPVTFYNVAQTYTATPPTTALTPSSTQVIAPPSFYMYFSS
jgi:hypothetical protein